MISTTCKCTFLIAAGASLAALGPAVADCQVTGPATMYLGDGGSYAMRMIARRSEQCTISFDRQAADVNFSSVDVVSPPKAGAFSGSNTYSLFYAPPQSGDTDSFTLKVCGKDTHGVGCNILNYSVTIAQ